MNLIRVIPAKGSGQKRDCRFHPQFFSSRLPPPPGERLFFLGSGNMDIVVNGSQESCAPGSVAELVAARGLPPEALVVELNGKIIRQEQWSQVRLGDGDRLELLSFVGGG
jgi:thiamine biosynthesis protein ThiS